MWLRADVSHTCNRCVSGTRIKAVAVREEAGLAASNARDVGKFPLTPGWERLMKERGRVRSIVEESTTGSPGNVNDGISTFL